MKNKKPKYWVVKNDGSQLFKDTVIKKMNEIDKTSSTPWKAGNAGYYGYDGGELYSGTSAKNDIKNFENNPELLSLFDFIDLFMKGDEDIKAGDTVFVRDFYYEKWQKGKYITTLSRKKYSNFIVEVENIRQVDWKQIRKIPKYTTEDLTKIVGHTFEIED